MARVLVLLALLCATQTQAGPWPLGKGDVFLSFGANVAVTQDAEAPVHTDPSLYLEYGLTEKLTVGFTSFSSEAGEAISGYAFARYPVLPRLNDPLTVTIGAGLKYRFGDLAPDPRIQLGFSWCHGWDNAWATIVTNSTYSTTDQTTFHTLDATYGWRPTDNIATIFQLQTVTGETVDFYAKIAPSVAYTFGDHLTVELGLIQALTGDRGTGLRLGTWIEF